MTRLTAFTFHLVSLGEPPKYRTATFYASTEAQARGYAEAWCQEMGWRIEP